MKNVGRISALIAALGAVAALGGCATYGGGYRGYSSVSIGVTSGPGYHRDRDHDGIPNRYDRDRDGDGIPNRFDRRPDNPYRP